MTILKGFLNIGGSPGATWTPQNNSCMTNIFISYLVKTRMLPFQIIQLQLEDCSSLLCGEKQTEVEYNINDESST